MLRKILGALGVIALVATMSSSILGCEQMTDTDTDTTPDQPADTTTEPTEGTGG